ncbi:glycosyltransferase family 2 protein [Kocuria massiliensis]|uniref:glycosyltransferase family 2 protein n=1 Tax=Kocuria massiliensis TaxID=1926282 RepID=UPI0022B97097|nr:glycosyltransferase [Kocuria massiliensis]
MIVTVDGVQYTPATGTNKVGVAVSTHNRHDTLAHTLTKISEHTPGAHIVVVDDGSDIPVTVPEHVHLIRHDESQGIAATKNAGIAALMKAGCEHLFLFDDDAYPIKDDWADAYINNPEPHLMRIFADLSGDRKLGDIECLYDDGETVAWTGPRGVMLYATRRVIETVGGMDLAYGRWGWEHGDWSNRIYHAGLTRFRFADVANGGELIYSLDEHEEITRAVTPAQRVSLAETNAKLHNHRMRHWYEAYCPPAPRRVVITSLLTYTVDPQRGQHMNGELTAVKEWAESVKGAEPVVFVDHDVTPLPGVTVIQVPPMDMNPYYRRWLLAYQYLRDNPDVTKAFVTDGTDVVMLHEPWDDMHDGVVYVGSEPKTLGDSWMWDNHTSLVFQDFLRANEDEVMLNAGLLGGNREDVADYAHKITRFHFDLTAERFWGNDKSHPEVGDMAAFNVVGHDHFTDRFVTGPRVHTVFKTDGVGKDHAWFKHR